MYGLTSILKVMMGFPGDSDSRGSACNAGDPGLIPGLTRPPREGHGYTPVFLPVGVLGEFSRAGYSPYGLTESNTTERLTCSCL